jgi:chromosome segregation ATPase
MKPYPVSPPPLPAAAADDPESTAELPVIDSADCEPEGRTDALSVPATEYPTPVAADDAEATQQLDAGPQAVSARMREIRERLAGKNERLRQLENTRDEEHASRAAAEQRAADLNAQLAQLQAAAAQSAAQIAELTQSGAVAAERATRLADELARARSAAEQRAVQSNEELAQALSLASTASARATQERAHSERLTGELQAERARSASYFEALQTVEGRRAISAELLVDLQREAQAREAELAGLGRDLVGQHAQVRELEAQLAQGAGRITRLEQQVSSFTAGLAQRDTQLHEARQESQGLRQGVSRLQTELTAGSERERASAALAEQYKSAVARQQRELERLGAEHAGLQDALESARVAAVASAAQLAALQAALVSARERTAQLEAALAAERGSRGQLESELEKVRGEMEDWGQALRSAQRERDGHLAAIAAGAARVGELEQQATEQSAAVRALRAQADAGAARVSELEAGLRASEEAVNRVESEARGRKARIAELEKATQTWRSALDEMRLNSTDSRPRPVLRDVVQGVGDDKAPPPAEPPPAEAAPDSAVRLLIQTAGGREIVHVLGRRTSIGRTPDNDLQIEAKCVSRRHAVILTGPLQTVIEDLNSTNGVLVNGQRVSRQLLKDGDRVVIGLSAYRFAVYKAGTRR